MDVIVACVYAGDGGDGWVMEMVRTRRSKGADRVALLPRTHRPASMRGAAGKRKVKAVFAEAAFAAAGPGKQMKASRRGCGYSILSYDRVMGYAKT